nr:hypothetical protein GCM10025732_09710 [Glycomyces mayteni]
MGLPHRRPRPRRSRRRVRPPSRLPAPRRPPLLPPRHRPRPLDDHNIAYYPGAFAPGSRLLLERLFPDAVIADAEDAAGFGLNFVSDGRNVVINAEAEAMARKVDAAGYTPVPVDLSELKKGGGSVKCCTAELRR